MAYVLPQVLVFQDFQVVPSAVQNVLRAHVSGPHAYLLRYAETDERDKGDLGYYDRLVAESYEWPDRPAGGVIDQTYVKLWIKDALLKYFEDGISSGSTVTKTASYNNRIRSATVNFAENGDYARDADLLDRDVAPGDVVKVRGVNGDDESVTLWTYVKSLIGDTVASTIEAAATDTENPDTQLASSAVAYVSGAINCIVPTASHAAYDGLADGDINETYDVLVLESSVNGDLTTGLIRVISGSGDDDVASAVPSAVGTPTDIGTRGLTVTFNDVPTASTSESAEEAGVSPQDLIAGQRWQVTVHQAFTKPVPTEGGTYDGTSSTTYVVEVTRGGTYAGDTKPQISVSTTSGIDLSGPTTVSASGTEVDVGSFGLTIEFSGTALRKGDRYYIEVVGETEGPMRTIELGHNISADIASGSQVDVTLFIRKSLLQVEKNRTGFAPITNWDVSETEITVNDGIVAYDETWTDGGVQEPLDVYSESTKGYGKLFVEYRAWRSDLASDVYTIQDVGELNNLISGDLHPDNPLKWGVSKTLANANGVEVKFTAVAEPEEATSWANVLELLLGRDDVYGLVPLTRDKTVLDLYAAHVEAQSSPEQGLWRRLWVNLTGIPEIPVVSAGSDVAGHLEATTADGEVCLAVVEDDPLTSGSQYTIVRVVSDNGNFVANGVRPGDIVRMSYTGDGFGNYVYHEYVVDEVQSEDQLRLLVGPGAPITVGAKVEVWRNLTATEESAAVAVTAGAYGATRVSAVWPDRIESSGTIMEGYHLCAALAGLSSGVLPHQGLTNVEIQGFSSVPRTTNKFNRSQLDVMAEAGAWIVTQSRTGGEIYTRHAVTTGGNDDVNTREEMITRNVDSVSFRFKDTFAPFIGVTNVTPSMQARLRLEVGKLITLLRTESASVNLGGQIINATILSFEPHATLLDRYVLILGLEVPKPFNNLEVHLVI